MVEAYERSDPILVCNLELATLVGKSQSSTWYKGWGESSETKTK